jgi:hypothetical protein
MVAATNVLALPGALKIGIAPPPALSAALIAGGGCYS